MISPDLLVSWKKTYGSVFSVALGKSEYVFRELTFNEYDEILSHTEDGSADVEDYLVKIGLLYPEDLDFDRTPAGIISRLAQEILTASGLGEPQAAKEILDREREKVSEFRGLMKAFVLAVMGAYKEEDLDAMTFSQLAAKVAMAEQVIKVNQAAFGIENDVRLDLLDPEEVQARIDEENAKRAVQTPGQAKLGDPIADQLARALGN